MPAPDPDEPPQPATIGEIGCAVLIGALTVLSLVQVALAILT